MARPDPKLKKSITISPEDWEKAVAIQSASPATFRSISAVFEYTRHEHATLDQLYNYYVTKENNIIKEK